jgi:hypothetical protein
MKRRTGAGYRWERVGNDGFKEEHDDDEMKYQTKMERERLGLGSIRLSYVRWQVEMDRLRKKSSEF